MYIKRFALIVFLLYPLVKPTQVIARNPDFKYSESRVFTLKEKSNGRFYVKSKVQISSEYISKKSLKEKDVFIYQPNYSQISNIKARVGSRWISKLNISSYFDDFVDAFISDNKIHHIYIDKNLNKGDVVTYEYKEKFSDINFFPILSIPNINYVKDYELTFEHDKETRVEFEFFFPVDSLNYKISRESNKKTTIIFRNLKELEETEYFPFNSFLAAIKVTFKKNGKYINFSDPESFVSWYDRFTDIDPKLDSTGVAMVPDSVINNHLTDLDKIKTIYNFTKKIKYLSDERKGHGIIPFKPTFVLKNQWGDCKDKAALVCALADQVGLKVNMALINTEDAVTFSGVHPTNFNHVINYMELNGQPVFFDATGKYNSFGIVGESLNGKNAFIMDKENPRYKLITFPMDSCNLETKIEGNLDSLNKSQAVITLRYDYALMTKHLVNRSNRQEMENYLVTWINSKYSKISFNNFKLIKVGANFVKLLANADLSRFIIETKTKKYLPEAAFTLFNKNLIKRDKDDLPLYLESRHKWKLDVDIKGDGFFLPDTSNSIGDSTASFSFNTQKTQDSIQMKYEFKLNQRIINNHKNNFLNFMKSYAGLRNSLYAIKIK